jgi:hypothetical protein
VAWSSGKRREFGDRQQSLPSRRRDRLRRTRRGSDGKSSEVWWCDGAFAPSQVEGTTEIRSRVPREQCMQSRRVATDPFVPDWAGFSMIFETFILLGHVVVLDEELLGLIAFE